MNFSYWFELAFGFLVIDLFILSGALRIFPGSFNRLHDDIKKEKTKIK